MPSRRDGLQRVRRHAVSQRRPTFDIPQGEPGAPGEGTTGQLDAAISGTAQNPSGIGPWTGGFSDPPTQGEMQDFAASVETLRVALVR